MTQLPGYGQNIVRIDQEVVDAIAAALGGPTDAAAAGDPSATDSAIAYLKQLINTLEGTVGIPAWPAGTAPANNVSIAEAIRFISEIVDSAESVGPFSYLDAGGEQDVIVDAATTRRRISLEIDLNTMTQNGTVRVYRQVDGTNYRIWIEEAFLAAGNEKVIDSIFTTNHAWKLTYEEDVDEGADRSVPFNVVTEVIE